MQSCDSWKSTKTIGSSSRSVAPGVALGEQPRCSRVIRGSRNKFTSAQQTWSRSLRLYIVRSHIGSNCLPTPRPRIGSSSRPVPPGVALGDQPRCRGGGLRHPQMVDLSGFSHPLMPDPLSGFSHPLMADLRRCMSTRHTRRKRSLV